MMQQNEWSDLTLLHGLLAAVYEQRPCFICGRRGQCCHREPDVELALAAAEVRHG